MLKSNSFSGRGVLPDRADAERDGRTVEEMGSVVIVIGGEGLKPTSDGYQIKRNKVIDDPFAEAKELFAGFCMFRCKTKEEAVKWSWRWLDVHCGGSVAKEARSRSTRVRAERFAGQPGGGAREAAARADGAALAAARASAKRCLARGSRPARELLTLHAESCR